jgi:hypothetical protein
MFSSSTGRFCPRLACSATLGTQHGNCVSPARLPGLPDNDNRLPSTAHPLPGGFTDIASFSGYAFDGVTMSNGVTDAFGKRDPGPSAAVAQQRHITASRRTAVISCCSSPFLLPLGIDRWCGQESVAIPSLDARASRADLDFSTIRSKNTPFHQWIRHRLPSSSRVNDKSLSPQQEPVGRPDRQHP